MHSVLRVKTMKWVLIQNTLLADNNTVLLKSFSIHGFPCFFNVNLADGPDNETDIYSE